MNGIGFNSLVRKEFAFLINDFEFRIVKERFEPALMGNAGVILMSSSVVLSIVKDRGQVLINIGEVLSSRDEWLEFTDVVRFFATNESLDVYQFGVNPYDVPPVENQLSRLAILMREYCFPMLRGDFSMKNKIKSLEQKRSTELFKRSTKQ